MPNKGWGKIILVIYFLEKLNYSGVSNRVTANTCIAVILVLKVIDFHKSFMPKCCKALRDVQVCPSASLRINLQQTMPSALQPAK